MLKNNIIPAIRAITAISQNVIGAKPQIIKG